eukprot:9436176-Lingulodinium_polyedra.AAC.1
MVAGSSQGLDKAHRLQRGARQRDPVDCVVTERRDRSDFVAVRSLSPELTEGSWAAEGVGRWAEAPSRRHEPLSAGPLRR